jgi:hypothetical protein
VVRLNIFIPFASFPCRPWSFAFPFPAAAIVVAGGLAISTRHHHRQSSPTPLASTTTATTADLQEQSAQERKE